MSEQSVIPVQSFSGLAVPVPRVAIAIRPAALDDLPFMDALQKKHSKQLGYFPTKQFEGYIAGGHVLVAEGASIEGQGASEEGETAHPSAPVLAPCPLALAPTPLGYIISRDRYLKRDELGVIYQLCVSPGQQRKLVGAALVQAVFERAAYGCRLFCCWCAQDLAANFFWESMGFVPIAFRAGSTKRKGQVSRGKGQVNAEASSSTSPLPLNTCPSPAGRVHIFWQKRIRQGDTTTPWWFPSKTESGALRADRLVLPIPRGLRWDEQMPVLLPEAEDRVSGVGSRVSGEEKKKRLRGSSRTPTPETRTPKAVQFGKPGRVMPTAEKPPARPAEIVKVPRPKAGKPKCDPKLVQVARELRDRWLEQVNADPTVLLCQGKYDVRRVPDETHATRAALPAPIAA